MTPHHPCHPLGLHCAPMKASGIVWNEGTVAAFLRVPGKLVPGTRMCFWGISDDNQIAALLAYLRTFRRPAAEAPPAGQAPAPAPVRPPR